MLNVTRTRRALRSVRRTSHRLGTTLLQATAAVIPPELIIVAARFGSIAAVLFVVPFGVFVASRVVALVVPRMFRDAVPTGRVNARNIRVAPGCVLITLVPIIALGAGLALPVATVQRLRDSKKNERTRECQGCRPRSSHNSPSWSTRSHCSRKSCRCELPKRARFVQRGRRW